jgi:hypothetical protein
MVEDATATATARRGKGWAGEPHGRIHGDDGVSHPDDVLSVGILARCRLDVHPLFLVHGLRMVVNSAWKGRATRARSVGRRPCWSCRSAPSTSPPTTSSRRTTSCARCSSSATLACWAGSTRRCRSSADRHPHAVFQVARYRVLPSLDRAPRDSRHHPSAACGKPRVSSARATSSAWRSPGRPMASELANGPAASALWRACTSAARSSSVTPATLSCGSAHRAQLVVEQG